MCINGLTVHAAAHFTAGVALRAAVFSSEIDMHKIIVLAALAIAANAATATEITVSAGAMAQHGAQQINNVDVPSLSARGSDPIYDSSTNTAGYVALSAIGQTFGARLDVWGGGCAAQATAGATVGGMRVTAGAGTACTGKTVASLMASIGLVEIGVRTGNGKPVAFAGIRLGF